MYSNFDSEQLGSSQSDKYLSTIVLKKF